MKDIRAIFFDLGGTLFSNRAIPKVSMPVLEDAAERLGLSGGIASIGRQYVDATQAVNKRYVDRPFYLHRDLFLETSDHMLEQLDKKPSPDFNEWFYAAQREAMCTQIRLRRDCLDTLAHLRSREFALCVVSNIDNDYLEPMMKNLELDSHFDHWISSESARSCKPDRRIFEHALVTMERAPEEVLFVGDSRVHDVQGAGRVGIRSVMISEEGGVSHYDDETFDAKPDHTIGKLSELVDLVAL